MIARRVLSVAFIVSLFAPHSALALGWEIERNFRYFLYPSDMAEQRVTGDPSCKRARLRRPNNLNTL